MKNVIKLSPLTEASFYILLSLNNPKHGYGVIKEVEKLTNERLILAPGTLYGVLTTFTKNGLIEIVKEESVRKKKTYKITRLGLTLLEFEVNRINGMVQNAKEVLYG
jgi:DNA-binding PadR family transcriptional regulator